jgi:nuclear pore complex protein Nup188
MAPVPEAYFPSLDKCFSGDVQLLYGRFCFSVLMMAADPAALIGHGRGRFSMPVTQTVTATTPDFSTRFSHILKASSFSQIAMVSFLPHPPSQKRTSRPKQRQFMRKQLRKLPMI